MFKREVQFDQEEYTVTVPAGAQRKGVQLAVFDKVVVSITVEKDQTTQRSKVKMVLVEPVNSEDL
jgi:exosome complex exonuclease DIS3/RRP44